MAEEEAAVHAGAHAGGKGLDALKQKVGPLPLYVWLVVGLGVWYYFQRKNASSATAGGQTDPAGNVGNIDPATGYVYGSPEDQAALAANSGSGGDTSSSTSGSTTSGQYPDNNAWAEAAINYLVGIGIDPTAANEAIQNFLASQQMTSQQQADVNMAIQAIGPPPELPGPVGTPPTPIVKPPPPGTIYATNPPTGLTTGVKTSSTVALKWNKTSNAKGYTVKYGTTSAATGGSQTVTGTSTSVTVTKLKPGTHYYFRVQATPAKTGAAFASVSATTAKTPATTPHPGPIQKPAAKTYTVKKGDTLSGIATRFKYPGGWEALYQKNKKVIGDNPNLIRPGEVLQV